MNSKTNYTILAVLVVALAGFSTIHTEVSDKEEEYAVAYTREKTLEEIERRADKINQHAQLSDLDKDHLNRLNLAKQFIIAKQNDDVEAMQKASLGLRATMPEDYLSYLEPGIIINEQNTFSSGFMGGLTSPLHTHIDLVIWPSLKDLFFCLSCLFRNF